MFSVHKEKIGDVTVILCEGRMVGGDAAFKLRDEVKRQKEARVVLIDLSELGFLGGDVLRMLVRLQAWTHVAGIQFKLFDPSPFVSQSLQRLGSTAKFEIVSTHDVLSLLHWEGTRNGPNSIDVQSSEIERCIIHPAGLHLSTLRWSATILK